LVTDRCPTHLRAVTFPQMPNCLRRLAIVTAVALSAFGLSACGTINEKLADGLGDYVPQWAGGLPSDVPPRPGTIKYDEFMQERERKRLEPAASEQAKVNTQPSSTGSLY
jgi:hypothetical protein